MSTEIRQLLRPLLARRRSPAERRALAVELRQIADEQEHLADADEQVGHVVRSAQLDTAPRRGGRRKGTGARYLRWTPPQGEGKGSRRSGRLFIGRALWQELGEPKRMDVQRLGAELHVRPCGEGVGWAISRGAQTMPGLNIGEESADTLRLTPGRWEAEIRSGAIVVRLSKGGAG